MEGIDDLSVNQEMKYTYSHIVFVLTSKFVKINGDKIRLILKIFLQNFFNLALKMCLTKNCLSLTDRGKKRPYQLKKNGSYTKKNRQHAFQF